MFDEIGPAGGLRIRPRGCHGSASLGAGVEFEPSVGPAASVVVEHLAQFAREGFGLAGVSELAAEEAALVGREHGRLLAEQFGGGDRRASDEPVQRLLAWAPERAGSEPNPIQT